MDASRLEPVTGAHERVAGLSIPPTVSTIKSRIPGHPERRSPRSRGALRLRSRRLRVGSDAQGERGVVPLLIALAIALLASGCRFAPELGSYPSCREGASCPIGYRCVVEEGVCVRECGETGLDCEGPATDAGLDAGLDAGTADAGALDAGLDAGSEDAGLDTEPLRFITEALEAAQVDSTYVQVLCAEGGTGRMRFSIVGGGMPAGLSLMQEGTLGGTPTVAGSSSFVVQVSDEGVPQQVAARSFSLTVNPASGTPLTITTTSLPAGDEATAYAAQLAATGGTEPYTWSMTGALPAGLVFFNDGRIEGTPASAGESTLDITVRDSDPVAAQSSLRTFVLHVQPASGEALAMVTDALPGGEVGTYYLAELTASGGEAPYTWSLTSGSSLPAGLTLSGNIISGSPATAGATSFGLQVADSAEPRQLATRSFSLSVVSGSTEPLSITTSSLADGRLNSAYSQTLATSGGTPPVSFALAGASELPPGLSLATGGLVSGTPESAGSYSFAVVATDATEPAAQSATRSFTMTVTAGGGTNALSVVTSVLPDGSAGQAYAAGLTASGGQPPYSWSYAGTLPSGIELTSEGVLQGTPSEANEWRFSAKVTDSAQPPQFASKGLVLIVQPSSLRIDTSTLPRATLGVAYRVQINASGGVPPYAFRVSSGTLPQGLSLCGSNPPCANPGEIAGTPASRAHSPFEIEVSDSSAPPQATRREFSIDID